MDNMLSSELLCLGLILIVCGRIFFLSGNHVVHVSVLAPVSFFVSLLHISIWGLSPIESCILILSFLTLLLNMHSLSRFIFHLYVDNYRAPFFFFSTVFGLITIALIAAAVYFRPESCKKISADIEIKKEIFKTNTKESTMSGVLWTIEPKSAEKKNGNIVLFSADKKADTDRYLPYLLFLADKGYTIYSTDAYIKQDSFKQTLLSLPILRRPTLRYNYYKNPDRYKEKEEQLTESIQSEYSYMLSKCIQPDAAEKKFFLVCDSMSCKGAQQVKEMHPDIIQGLYNLSDIAEYSYSGFGCIEQRDIILCYFNKIQRDRTFFIPRYLALKTANRIQETL